MTELKDFVYNKYVRATNEKIFSAARIIMIIITLNLYLLEKMIEHKYTKQIIK